MKLHLRTSGFDSFVFIANEEMPKLLPPSHRSLDFSCDIGCEAEGTERKLVNAKVRPT